MKIKRTIFLLASLFSCFLSNGYAQTFLTDSSAAAKHHHTPWEMFSGDGADEFVCYKQAHRNWYFLCTGLIVVIALIALKLLQTNRKTNRLLKAQNEIIEEKNKDITDSIYYARKIQRSLLPPEKYIQKSLDRLKKE